MSNTRPNVLPFAPVATAKAQVEALNAFQAWQAFKRRVLYLGWTLEQTARACGKDKSTISRYLSGESRVDGGSLLAIGAVVVANDNKESAA